jgi:hypothetical protein
VQGGCAAEQIVEAHVRGGETAADDQGFSREINYQLFSLILVYIYCETEYVRVCSYVSYVLEKPWDESKTRVRGGPMKAKR